MALLTPLTPWLGDVYILQITETMKIREVTPTMTERSSLRTPKQRVQYTSGVGKKKTSNIHFWVHKAPHSPFVYILCPVEAHNERKWEKSVVARVMTSMVKVTGRCCFLTNPHNSNWYPSWPLAVYVLWHVGHLTSAKQQQQETGDYPNATNHGRLATSSDKTQTWEVIPWPVLHRASLLRVAG